MPPQTKQTVIDWAKWATIVLSIICGIFTAGQFSANSKETSVKLEKHLIESKDTIDSIRSLQIRQLILEERYSEIKELLMKIDKKLNW